MWCSFSLVYFGNCFQVNATTSVDDVFETIRPLFKRYEQVTGPIYLLCLLSFIHHITRVFWCTGKSAMQRRIGMQYCCPAECFRQPKDCYIQVSVHRRFHWKWMMYPMCCRRTQLWNWSRESPTNRMALPHFINQVSVVEGYGMFIGACLLSLSSLPHTSSEVTL